MRRPFVWLFPPLLAASLTAQQVAEGPEPNDSTTTATVLTVGAEVLGTLATPGDTDWYRVTLTGTSDLHARTTPGLGAEAGDTTLALYDATGGWLADADDGVGMAWYAELLMPRLAAGTYYLAVGGGTHAVAGSYALDVRRATSQTLSAPGSTVVESAENNDPRSGGTATAVFGGARCSGAISTTGPAGDWDFYRLVLLNDTYLQVRVDATPAHPVTPRMDDPLLYLFDGSASPQLLAGPYASSNFGVWDAALDAALPAGIYHLAIRGWSGSIAGSYYLDVHTSTLARAAVFAGGCGGRHLDVATTGVGPGAPLRLERPTIGTTWSLRGSSLGAGGFAFHAFGFQSTAIDLTTLGAPGCTLEVVWVDALLGIADALGDAAFALALPENPAVLGTQLTSQLAVLDLSNPLGFTFSNRVEALVGN